ncbi:MAG: copper chaperone PCu(A)C [Cellulomonas sp.]
MTSLTRPSRPAIRSNPRPAGRATAAARLLSAGALGLSLFALTGCAAESPAVGEAAATSATDPAAPSTAAALGAAAVTVTDPWIKAADSGMTAVFGTLVNGSDAEVRFVSAVTSASPKMELHEMAKDDAGQMVMRPKVGGFVLPAGGSHELAPGGDHLMIMDISAPVKPGDEVSVTLTADDGSELTFMAPARTYTGGNETYAPGAMSTPAAGAGMDATPMPAAS